MTVIDAMRERLPGPVMTWARVAYAGYRMFAARGIIADLVEFHNQLEPRHRLSYVDALCIFKASYRLNNDLWRILRPESPEEITSFYEVTPWYLFELAYWHTDPRQRKFRRTLLRLARGRVLDYGGGIGDLSLALARKGLPVTYGEVKGRNAEFARWMFKKHGLSVNYLELGAAQVKLPDEYDTIVCIDVIEHVPEAGKLIEEMAAHLRIGGALMITQLDYKEALDGNPQHFPLDFDSAALMKSLGLARSGPHDWLWTKVRLESPGARK